MSHAVVDHWDSNVAAPEDVYAPLRARAFARDQVLLVVDARHACYRCYHTRDLSAPSGEPTSALHGVLEMLRAACEAANTRRLVLCWDGGLEYKRRLYKSYKSRHDRALTAEEEQERAKREAAIKLVRAFATAAGIPQVHIPDAEADDAAGIVGTLWANALAVRKVCPDPHVVYLTDDKDYYQLLSPREHVWRGVMRELVDVESFRNRHGFEPDLYVHYKALVGESKTGDDIPGVPGIGDVTAGKLIAAHGTIYDVIKAAKAAVARGPARKVEQNLAAHEHDAILSLRLSRIARTFADLVTLGCDGEGAKLAVHAGLRDAARTSRPLGDVRPVLAGLGFVKLDLRAWAASCGFSGA